MIHSAFSLAAKLRLRLEMRHCRGPLCQFEKSWGKKQRGLPFLYAHHEFHRELFSGPDCDCILKGQRSHRQGECTWVDWFMAPANELWERKKNKQRVRKYWRTFVAKEVAWRQMCIAMAKQDPGRSRSRAYVPDPIRRNGRIALYVRLIMRELVGRRP